MLKCHLRETNTCVIHHSPLAGVHMQPVAHRTGHTIALTDKTPKTWLDGKSEKAAICLLENPRCRHSVYILKPHKAAKIWVAQPPQGNPIPCRARFCSAGKRPPRCIACRCCWVFIHLCSPLQSQELCWEPFLSYAPRRLGDSGLMFHLLILIQDKEYAEKDPWEQSIKWCQEGTVRKFWTISHPPCPCTEGDTTQIMQTIWDLPQASL